jgi:hypothetical protein
MLVVSSKQVSPVAAFEEPGLRLVHGHSAGELWKRASPVDLTNFVV